MRNTQRTITAASLAAIGILGFTACSSDNSSDAGPSSSSAAVQSSTAMSSGSTTNPAADLVGPGCADYAKKVPTGAGSVNGMAQDPVATAASNNPLLTTLVQAVSGKLNPNVNLVDTLSLIHI